MPTKAKAAPKTKSEPRFKQNIEKDGRKRVKIINVMPQIECGKITARTVVDEPTLIYADVFGDGHDEVKASVEIKKGEDGKWEEHPMEFKMNDRWEYDFIPEDEGVYYFRINGWIDHFATWKKGLKKKIDAGVDVSVEYLIGADLVEDAASSAKAKFKKQLEVWSEELRNEGREGYRSALALGHELEDVVAAAGDRTLATRHPGEYKIEVERRKALFSTWYELFPRSASQEPGVHGTLKDVERLLPRIEKMGFDVLYFPPIHPIGEVNRKGRNNSLKALEGDPGSPWAIGNRQGGHKSIHQELGSLDDFKALIKAAKGCGIDIAMDIAYQCAPDHPYVKEHPKWFKWRPDGTVQFAENPPKKYEDILPINFESEDWENLWNELRDVVMYWIGQGVEIFRVDNPHTKAFPFWEWMIAEVRKKHPRAIFLAEAFTRPRLMEELAKIGFTQSYTYFTWRETKEELETYLKELTQTERRYYFKPNFWPNTPDILPPHLTKGGDNAHVQRLILAATMSSNYGLYGPVYEFGMNQPHPKKEEYIDNEKYELKHWDWDAYTRLKDLMARINKIRNENRALQSTNNILFGATDNDQLIAYAKYHKPSGNLIFTVVNLDWNNTQAGYVQVPFEKMGLKSPDHYQVHDLLDRGNYKWQDEWNYVSLNPFEIPAHVFSIELTNK